MEFILILVVILAAVIHPAYWFLIFSRIISQTPGEGKHQGVQLSAIIASKNESQNISACLESLISNKNPITEIIVIDDYSSDQTAEIISDYQKKDQRIVCFTPSKDQPGKKLALTEAIDRAKNNIILLTDADCRVSKNWGRSMRACLQKNGEMVLGYSPVIKTDGFLNLWIRFETWITAVQYLSYALAGIPYMGVGRNLMYTKSLFEKQKGFSSHDSLVAGDDDLFVNVAASASNTSICLHPNSYAYTQSAKHWKEYIQQKRRHYSVSRYYKFRDILMLTFFSLSQISFYLALIISFIKGWPFLMIICSLVFIFKWLLACSIMRKMREQLCAWFPVLDLGMALYYMLMFPLLFLKKSSW